MNWRRSTRSSAAVPPVSRARIFRLMMVGALAMAALTSGGSCLEVAFMQCGWQAAALTAQPASRESKIGQVQTRMAGGTRFRSRCVGLRSCRGGLRREKSLMKQRAQPWAEEHFDVFFSYAHGPDRKNVPLVKHVYERLSNRGLTIWWDQIPGLLLPGAGKKQEQITSGVEMSEVFVIFLTKEYYVKVNADTSDEPISVEFNAARFKDKKMVVVVLQKEMSNDKNWTGTFGDKLKGELYIDLSCCPSLDDIPEEKLELLAKAVRGKEKLPEWAGYAAASLCAAAVMGVYFASPREAVPLNPGPPKEPHTSTPRPEGPRPDRDSDRALLAGIPSEQPPVCQCETRALGGAGDFDSSASDRDSKGWTFASMIAWAAPTIALGLKFVFLVLFSGVLIAGNVHLQREDSSGIETLFWLAICFQLGCGGYYIFFYL